MTTAVRARSYHLAGPVEVEPLDADECEVAVQVQRCLRCDLALKTGDVTVDDGDAVTLLMLKMPLKLGGRVRRQERCSGMVD